MADNVHRSGEPKMRQHKWSDYLICLAPITLLVYTSLESYGIDYRAFYLAGKAALNNLNPYINQITVSSSYYGPVNAELALYSGWKYPPLATLIFEPFALIPYEASKNLFNLISILVGVGSLWAAIRLSQRTLSPSSILIAGFSFPMLAMMDRGQVEIILVALATGSTYLISRGSAQSGSILIGILAAFKIYPLLLGAIFARLHRRRLARAVMALIATLAAISLLTLACTPASWSQSFLTRISIPWDQVPGQVLPALPNDSGIIEGTNMVRSADARNLLHSHEFVFGFGNPLLTKNAPLAALIAAGGIALTLRNNRQHSIFQQSLAVMPWINVANPLAWIMGVAWYIPLFLYSFHRVNPPTRFLLILPLILPPSLNVSAYLAAAISLAIKRFYDQRVSEQPQAMS